MTKEFENIDLTKAWLDYYLPTKEQQLVFRKFVKDIAKKTFSSWYNEDYHFLNYMTQRAIEIIAIKYDYVPYPLMIRLELIDVFYLYGAQYALRVICKAP